MIDITKLHRLAEGKTKIVYTNPVSNDTVYLYFKDDITAGDGLKHDIIPGKATLDWKINCNIFEYLNRVGLRTHYISGPEERLVLAKKLDRKINLEVVSRRIAAGSIVQWGKAPVGTRFEPVITQFHYKDDSLHDPRLDDAYIDYLIDSKGSHEYAKMRETNAAVLEALEGAFAKFGLQLVDLKLEYGIIDGEVYVIDEISAGSLRLWPYRHAHPNLQQQNVLSELNPEGRLDKDTYRMGERFDKVLAGFVAMAEITGKFRYLVGN